MSYLVLASKYRPKDFSEVIGQEEVTRTLENAVVKDRLANAYIFCGPRGIGKTSVARLIAKKLNCLAKTEERPCNKCEMCREIIQGSSLDVLEIDGASNNRVDEVRTLRENVKFSPSKGRYKIYIIDEVHMLSQGAFNALLKTLEEPPAHVKFIFATTEVHKVPATILSRCQRFDFKKISPVKIQENILRVAKKEKMKIREEAALLIARASDGSLRDSLVMLEQMYTFSRDEILAEDVSQLLGMVNSSRLHDLFEAVVSRDAAQAVKSVDEMITKGKDPQHITDDLIAYLRDVMIIKVAGEPTRDMVFTSAEKERMDRLLSVVSIEELMYMMQVLTDCLSLIKAVSFRRAPLELSIIRLTRREEMLSLAEVLNKLDNFSINGAQAPKRQSAESLIEAPSDKKEMPENNPKSFSGTSSPESVQKITDFGTLEKKWKAILTLIQKEKMSVWTYLQPARPIEMNGGELVIGFSKSEAFNRDALDTAESKKIIENAVRRLAGEITRVKLVVLDFLGGEEKQEKEASSSSRSALKEMRPALESVMDAFGGHVIRDYMEES